MSSLTFGTHVTIFSIHRPLSPEHRHKGLSPDFLRTALDRLRSEGYRFVSLEKVLSNPASVPSRSVCLTMDDGYADQAELLAPVLLEYETNATFFLITDLLDGLDWPWDEKVAYLVSASKNRLLHGLEAYGLPESLSIDSEVMQDSVRRLLQKLGKDLPAAEVPAFIETLSDACGLPVPKSPPKGYRPISWDTARSLEARGMHFAPHSCNHHITSRLSAEDAKEQFAQSWQRLREELKQPTKIYCYPTGRLQDFSVQHERALASLGYLGAVSFISNPLRLRNVQSQRFRLPRIAFPDNLPAVFRYASWLEALRSLAQPTAR
ncbi:polysaccharide deacetylase family protein [Gilvimarinus sp. F26214L]|uniref:polysaccharide deacetylase family protein n=1 Tax=Gilvimarinus sp. DZF01 TaxID=3461371 RepID=UPI004045A6F1